MINLFGLNCLATISPPGFNNQNFLRYQASFAYLMAKNRLNHLENRDALNQEELIFEQKNMKNYRLVVIPEDLEYDLYFMEVYIAGKLKTRWNSFKTH